MERVMRCAICEKKLGRFTCMKCGANVCEDCFDPAKGICKGCLSMF